MTKQLTSSTKTISTAAKLTLFIVMGVSGSGKTAVGKVLAKNLNEHDNCAHDLDFEFIDADDFHSPQAKQHMAANLPLDDDMRKPWITAIVKKLNELHQQQKNVVLAYSGLKQQHRNRFRALNFHCHFFYLSAEFDVIRSRMLARKNHFFSAQLLTSQFEAMEGVSNDEHDISKLDASTTFSQINKHILMLAHSELNKDLS